MNAECSKLLLSQERMHEVWAKRVEKQAGRNGGLVTLHTWVPSEAQCLHRVRPV